MGDSLFDNVTLLVTCAGTNGSTTFVDSSTQAHIITPYGNIVISDACQHFGENTTSFDGDKDALKIDPSSDWQFTINEPFTVEGWFYLKDTLLTGNAATYLITAMKQTSPQDYGWFLRVNRNTTGVFSLEFTIYELEVFPYTRDSLYSGIGSFSLEAWHHVAISYDGTTFWLSLDGEIRDTKARTLTSFATYSNSIWIGVDGYWDQDDYSCLDGYAHYIRITKNVARYAANFIPPVAADYLPVDNTGKRLIVGGSPYNDGNTTYTHALLDNNNTIIWSYNHGADITDIAVDETDNCCYVVGNVSSIDQAVGRKHSESGQLLFSFTNQGSYINAVCVDIDGNFYIGGAVNSSNISHKKYSSGGDLLWERSHGASVYCLVTDSVNNLYIGGSSISGIGFRKYAPNGDLVWSGNWGWRGVNGLAISSEGYLYTASYLVSALYDRDVIAKWDTNGNMIWAKEDSQGITGYDKLIIDQNDNLYAMTTNDETLSVVMYDKNGNELWRGSAFIDGWGGLTVDQDNQLTVVGCQTGNNLNQYDKFHTRVFSARLMQYLYAVRAYQHFTVPLPENISNLYNHASYLFHTEQVMLSDDLRVILVNSSYVYQAIHTSYSDIASYVCGEPVALANKTLNNTAFFSNPVKLASAGTQPNAFVLYVNTIVNSIDKPLLLYSAFTESFQPISVYDSLTITGNPWLQLN